MSSPQASPIGVIGLWHLGSVTAACLAQAGNEVVGLDPDPAVIEGLAMGRPPVAEPGLEELLGVCAQRLTFSSDPHALADARAAWIAFDTPVDDEDNADVEWVIERSVALLGQLPDDSLVIVSSQMPVGSVAALQARCAEHGSPLRFACVPENLRLGNALESFRAPERFVAGVRSERDRDELAEILAPFDGYVEWMSVESAEMTKHALNGFLATSVAFINEVAVICEAVGADAGEVSRGLKSERRIGPRAYLSPGDAFAGGTLARDIGFLRGLAAQHELPAHVFAGVADANAAHKRWAQRKLIELLGEGGAGAGAGLAGRRVAVWGLTYKPGTDTLRRSSAIELCRWLASEGASVHAHDPAVSALPAELSQEIELSTSPLEAAMGADALVVCTAWPEYREVAGEGVAAALAQPVVLDAAGFLAQSLGAEPSLRYARVGSVSTSMGAR
ncbi:MAG: nucleotide sugar dehydrogenase [Solirubrobacteraceae bacterium]